MSSVLGVGSSSGGSTLTQQLIKQQVTGDAPTFKRKAAEIIYALQLERRVSKNEILTDYLNVSPFGRNNKGKNIAGIEEAAQGYLWGICGRFDSSSGSLSGRFATEPDCLLPLYS